VPGAELFNFAERARQAGALAEAGEAYQMIVANMHSSPYWLSSSFGLAQILQARGRYTEALVAYQNVRTRQPQSPWAMRAWFQEGDIYQYHLRQPDRAAAAYRYVVEHFSADPERTEAMFRLGDCALADDDVAGAADWYRKGAQRGTPLMRDKATYRLARLEFYQGHVRKTQRLLDAIPSATELGSSTESMVNDALEMQLLLDANLSDSSGALLAFAHAELAVAQSRPAAAVDTLQNLLRRFPRSAVCPLALFTLGRRYVELGDYPNALQSYQRFLKEYPSDMRADRCLMQIAELYEAKVNDRAKAVEAYERVLTDFPKSLFLDEARRQLRQLSAKAPPVMN